MYTEQDSFCHPKWHVYRLGHLVNQDTNNEISRLYTAPSLPSPSPSDRLGELERDKARLTEQLMVHQREQMVREMDILKKSKSKNLLKKGFKKLRVKIQVGCTSCELHGSMGMGGCTCTAGIKKVDKDMVKVTVLLF